MKQITLDNIYLENFKCFRGATWITLSPTAGLKFLSGKNTVDPQLGSNGAGKSTIWDALCWCLFGTGVRGQKASDLVSWNAKQPNVMVYINIDEQRHLIERWGNPNRILVNKFNCVQEDVDRLIGLTRDRFLQSVLFGQSAPLFLDLHAPARGELLDGVLDLELWLSASEAAGRQAASLAQESHDLDGQLQFERGRLIGAGDDVMMERLRDRWQGEHDAAMEHALAQVEHTEQTIKELEGEIADINDQSMFLPDFEMLDLQIEKFETALRRVTAIDKSIEFYSDTDVCPTCLQPVSIEHRHAGVTALREQKGHADANEYRQDLMSLHAEKQRGMARKQELANKLTEQGYDLAYQKKHLGVLVEHTEKLGADKNPYTERLIELQTIKAATEAKLAELVQQQTTCVGKLAVAEFWKTAFKKVRLFQVKQVLQRLEIETSNVADALGIGAWQIHYVTETETKSGSMRPGIQVLVNNGRWESYSGGEAQRIRLAVTLGLASLIQGLAGVNYGFEILDEASQYLSIEGVEDLLSCLQARAEVTGKSIWVCDHSALAFGGFDETWCVTKGETGSTVENLTHTN